MIASWIILKMKILFSPFIPSGHCEIKGGKNHSSHYLCHKLIPNLKGLKFCKKNKIQSFFKEQIPKLLLKQREFCEGSLFWQQNKSFTDHHEKLSTRGSLLSGAQTSHHTRPGLIVFCLLGKTSAAQKSSFTNTENAAALEFWSYLYCSSILKSTWSKRNHWKFCVLVGAKSCWELRVIGLARRRRQKQKQFGIGWDKNHRISQENRSQRTGQRTSVKNGFFWLVPSWEVCQKVQKVPKKFPQAKFHCAAFPWELSNGKTSRNFLLLLGLLVKKVFIWAQGF